MIVIMGLLSCSLSSRRRRRRRRRRRLLNNLPHQLDRHKRTSVKMKGSFPSKGNRMLSLQLKRRRVNGRFIMILMCIYF
jgi:hypothetical protein